MCIGVNLHAQDAGKDHGWQTEEDFRQSEADVKEKILWLEENPMSTASNNTKEITEYILDWLTNTPYLSVTFDEVFLESLNNSKKYKFGEKFRVTYLFGKSYYVITNVDNINEAGASARGIEGMVMVYQELRKIDPSVKHRLLDKYSRLVRSNKIIGYTQAQLDKLAAKSMQRE